MGFTTDEIQAASRRARARSRQVRNYKRTITHPMRFRNSVAISHGQSIDVGLGAWPHHEDDPHPVNRMVGDAMRSRNLPPNSAHNVYDPYGILAFKPLVATSDSPQNGTIWTREQTATVVNPVSSVGGDTIIHGIVNHFKRLCDVHDWRVPNDPERGFVPGITGFGGTKLADLTVLDNPQKPWFWRAVNFAQVVKNLSGQESSGLGFFHTCQGQTDLTAGTPGSEWAATFEAFYANLKQKIGIEIFGDNCTPAHLIAGADCKWVNNDPWLSIGSKQLEMAKKHQWCIHYGPLYPYPDDSSNHLLANGIRSLGAIAAVKLYQAVCLGLNVLPMHMEKAVASGNEFLIEVTNPDETELNIRFCFVETMPTLFPGAGIGIHDALGFNPVASVTVHDCAIHGVLSRAFEGSSGICNYAAREAYNGRGNICNGATYPDMGKYEHHPEWGDDRRFSSANIPVGADLDCADWMVSHAIPIYPK